MRSLILRVSTGILLPGLLLFSLWVLLRGHNAPGGGFIGGLIASAGFALRALSHDAARVRLDLKLPPLTLIGLGLFLALFSGLIAMFAGGAFLSAYWLSTLPLVGKLGTPMLFDVGVYLLVIGAVLASMLALSEVEA